jgi:chromosome segregation protein
MYLQRLEMQGFKTFAQRTILEFPELSAGNPGITSIVGPNGSGKSNIADAIRWVLGEQGLKLLRAKHSEDVIFSGSEKKARLNMAEVSIYLNNEDKKIPLDYSELVITRRLYRDGTSEYLINKNPLRLQDVTLLLAQAQFGQKSYSVIAQGMIDQILIGSVSDRKEFFYEATGVKEYQMKREQSMHKLSRTQENLASVELTLRELDPHLRLLERQVKRLQRREEVEKELRELQKVYYAEKWFDIEKESESLRSRLKESEGDEQSRLKTMNIFQEDLSALEARESINVHFEKLEAHYQRLLDERNRYLRELSTLKGKIDGEYAKVGQMNLVWLEKRENEIDEEIRESIAEIALMEDEERRLEQQLSEKQEEANFLETEIAGVSGDIAKVQARLAEYAEFSEKELISEIEVIVFGQEHLIREMNTIEDLSQLPSIRSEAKTLFERILTVQDKLKKSGKDLHAQEMLAFQEILNELLRKKQVILGSYGEVVSQNRLIEEKIRRNQERIEKLSEEKNNIALEMKQGKGGETEEREILSSLSEKREEVEAELSTLEKKLLKVKDDMKQFNDEEEKKRIQMIQVQKSIQKEQEALRAVTHTVNALKVESARTEVHREEIEREIAAALGGIAAIQPLVHSDAFIKRQADVLHPQIQRLKHTLELIGGIDEEAQKEHKEVKERHDFLHHQYSDLVSAKEKLHEIVTKLDEKIEIEFHVGFKKINDEFSRYFSTLFSGGVASLSEVFEEESVFDSTASSESGEEDTSNGNDEKETVPAEPLMRKGKVFVGVDITAHPPGKKLRHIHALSGGEKALTSIALLCAIIACNPSPFVLLDEVDAALDESNSEKFADILTTLSHKTQFIVITHNRATMRRSHILYGVNAGQNGVSQLISIKLDEAEKIAKR